MDRDGSSRLLLSCIFEPFKVIQSLLLINIIRYNWNRLTKTTSLDNFFLYLSLLILVVSGLCRNSPMRRLHPAEEISVLEKVDNLVVEFLLAHIECIRWFFWGSPDSKYTTETAAPRLTRNAPDKSRQHENLENTNHSGEQSARHWSASPWTYFLVSGRLRYRKLGKGPLLGSVQVVINGKILNKTAVSLLVINPSTNHSE